MKTSAILFSWIGLALGAAAVGLGDEVATPLKAEPLNEAPPEALSEAIRSALETSGVRVVDADGKPFADLWLVRSVAAPAAPSGPEGAVLHPYLKAGQLIGAIRLASEIGDYRAQPILEGVYTMRYGLQPLDGDHLGVSTYRDYVLLSLPEEDTEAGVVGEEDLEFLSTGASGTTHPAVFMLAPAPEGTEPPAVVRDEEEDRWGVVAPLTVELPDNETATAPIQLVLLGRGPV